MTYKERDNAKAQDSFKTKLDLFLFYSVISKKGFVKEEFKGFKIEKTEIKKGVDLVQLYSTKYYQFEDKDTIDEVGFTVKQIYDEIQNLAANHAAEIVQLKAHYVTDFENCWPFEEFKKFAYGADKCCAYCEISILEVEQLLEKEKIFKKANRGYTLEIDRKDSNHEYSADNCVLACYWCNNAKTDEFTYKEFKEEIGPAIKRVWEKRKTE